MATKFTEWIVNLKENISPKFNKINGLVSNTQTKLAKVTNNQKKFNTQVDKSKKSFSGLNSGAKNLVGTLGAIAAIGVFKNLAQESLRLFDVQQKAEASVLSTLQSTGGAVGRTLEDLKKQASDLQGITLFGDEQTLAAQSILLTFTKIRGEIFDQTIPLVQDLATKFGTDLKSASLQLGKALNDPVKGISALSRSGVSFSDSQKKMIESLVATNQLAKAQTIILNELQSEVGGSAKAAALAGTGGFQQLQNTIGDIQEQFGELIFRVMPAFNKILKPILSGISNFFNLINSNQVALDLIQSLIVGLGVAATAFGVYKIVTLAATVSQWSLNAAIAANPIGAAVIAVTALVTALTLLWKRSEIFRGIVLGLWKTMKFVFTNMFKLGVFVFGKLQEQFQRFFDFISPFFTGLKESVISFWNNIKFYFSKVANFGSRIFGGLLDLVKGVFTFDFSTSSTGLQKLKNALSSAGSQVAENFQSGFEKGVKEVRTEKSDKSKGLLDTIFANGQDKLAIGNTNNATVGKGLNTVSSGGNQVRNVSVSIGEVIGIKDLSVNEIKETTQRIGDIVLEKLVGAIGGAEQAL